MFCLFVNIMDIISNIYCIYIFVDEWVMFVFYIIVNVCVLVYGVGW